MDNQKSDHKTDLSDFRKKLINAIKVEKTTTYAQLERETGVNRFYFWSMVNHPDYEPSERVCSQLGIRFYRKYSICPKCNDFHDIERTCPKQKKPQTKRKYQPRFRVDLPVEISKHEKEQIRSMTKEQRLQAIIEFNERNKL